jgi:hypothetical protein
MKLFTFCVLLVLPLSAYFASINYEQVQIDELEQEKKLQESGILLQNQLLQRRGAFDVVLNLLPLYGWIKVQKFMNKKSLEKVIVRRFQINLLMPNEAKF